MTLPQYTETQGRKPREYMIVVLIFKSASLKKCLRVQYMIFITESQDHRMLEVGRDLCGSSNPTPLPKQGKHL